MKQYSCLVPGCDWHTRSTSDAEILRRASDHLKEVHGETVVRPDMVDRMKARITDVAPVA